MLSGSGEISVDGLTTGCPIRYACCFIFTLVWKISYSVPLKQLSYTTGILKKILLAVIPKGNVFDSGYEFLVF